MNQQLIVFKHTNFYRKLKEKKYRPTKSVFIGYALSFVEITLRKPCWVLKLVWVHKLNKIPSHKVNPARGIFQ